MASQIADHPLASIFPLLTGAAFDELVEDIRTHGVREKILLFQGKILDGRNRYRAARKAGRDCPTRVYQGPDPLGFVISLNIKRRHLNESQRAMVAARIANMQHGGDRRSNQAANLPLDFSQDAAATLLNVSERLLRSAKMVQQEEGVAPELIAAVDAGQLAVSVAAQAVTLSSEQQREIAARAEAGEINIVTKVIKQLARADREARLATKQRALPEQKFGVILADPEWQFETWSPDGMAMTAADNHYPTSPLKEIKDRAVPTIAAPDCVLFLWATVPMLPQALEVMGAWGFAYVSSAVWVKDRVGNGYWFRMRHELLLVGTRGNIPAPALGTQWESVIEQPRGAHSEKPEAVCELIEAYFPHLPKIELNRRGAPRRGWSAWGNEVEEVA
jgi:N6-adenosine-specific RNA methylase IME4/ParB-like chromosome segregation protein Spo0J